MSGTEIQFAGSIPDLYDRLLVPLIFAPYAADLAGRVADQGPESVLETAAGTGAVTRALSARLNPEVRITATDLSPAMLDRARSQGRADGRTEWLQADALALPFADASFDVVVCQFGVMFFPDRVRGYYEAARVLRPGGVFLFNVWDRIAANPVPAAVADAMTQMFPDNPPTFMANVPFGHSDTDVIARDLMAAGFALVRSEAVDAVARAPSAREVAVAFCQGTPLRSEIEERGADLLEEATAQVEALIAERFGMGSVTAPLRAYVITAKV